MQSLDLGLDTTVCSAGSLHLIHVLGVDVRVFALEMLSLNNGCEVDIHDQLMQLITSSLSKNDLNASFAGRAGREVSCGVLTLEVEDHLLLQGLL
jgi:hypothetical protein